VGQKVHPYSFRLGYIKGWLSQWYADKKSFAKFLHEDISIRKYIQKTLPYGGISKIEIKRTGERLNIIVHSSRPGIVIGRRGVNIDTLRDELQDETSKQIFIDIQEIKNPEVEAQLIAENIAFQLTRRVNFRRAMKKAIQLAMEKGGVEGIRISCAGRLGGAEMSRKEVYKEGKIPLQTIRADIDYGFSEANTTAGVVGVKVWVYHGDILFPHQPDKEEQEKNITKQKRNKRGR